LFQCFRLFEVANDREFETREETVIDNLVVLSLVGGARHVVARLRNQFGALVNIQFVSLDVFEFKAEIFKHTMDATRLHPEKSGKEKMERPPLTPTTEREPSSKYAVTL